MTPHTDDEQSAVLTLRLASPRQSWGHASKYNRRDTNRFPTKSGLVGLLANAQGRDFNDSVTDLAALTLAVRLDQPGTLATDYHTLSDYRGSPLPATEVTTRGTQKLTTKITHLTERDYIDDAVFVAAFQGPAKLIADLAQAVRDPARLLYLGRRSCPLLTPPVIGVYNSDVDTVLTQLPWQAARWAQQKHAQLHNNATTVDLEVAIDDIKGTETLNDVPVSFAVGYRSYATRRVRHTTVTVVTDSTAHVRPVSDDQPPAEHDGHDPFALLE